jgi:hypothetical protein
MRIGSRLSLRYLEEPIGGAEKVQGAVDSESALRRRRGAALVAAVLLLAGLATACAGNQGAATPTHDATLTPDAAPTPIQLSAQGSQVFRVALRPGPYKVGWSARGHEVFIVRIHLNSDDFGLINESPPKPTGETVWTAPKEATYAVQVQASNQPWTLTFTKV